MELTFECPECKMIDHTDDVEAASQSLCRHCHTARDLRPGAFDASGGPVACPSCGSADLYVRKDFPQSLGLVIVVVGFAASTVFWYYERALSAYGVLGASLLLDLALYRWVPDVLVCYRCGSQLRGPGVNPGRRFRSFDLALGERYRQERLRSQDLRDRGASAGSDESQADVGAT
ncbi:hypothetical protein [Paludisphaera mucosa]|uniref:Uncharacterized protein n=1 Tax=Paludisphaera mucosa TaxID=3030827 RepID=A0ABT6FCR0_9BACT|nr:hypothetical protein [Paludisphaera mucosa]MDG3005379.1 hypothetical protein [Paludisphaera mucosa]